MNNHKSESNGKLLTGVIAALSFFSLFILSIAWADETSAASEAMRVPDAPELYKRVLILPDAKILETPGDEQPADFKTLPVFSVRYVYGEKEIGGKSWIEIGKEPVGGSSGWLLKPSTEEWKSMLVMQFAPRGQRDRVLFFNKKQGIEKCIAAEMVGDHFTNLYQQVQSGQPNRSLLTAIEPRNSIDARAKPYLMPILDWSTGEYESGDEITLVKVASLNAEIEGSPAGGDGGGEGALPGAGEGGGDETPPGDEIADFKIGIVFVIDTTQSMGPYIDKTYEAVEAVYEKLEEDGNLDKASFGIIGYRDDTSYSQGIEYVTRVFQDLDPDTPPSKVLESIRKVKAAKTSTAGWDEDAVAGLNEAVTNINWEPYSGRLIVLISDAGARVGNDPRAAISNMSMANIYEMAQTKRIAIFPMHLRTPKAEAVGNLPRAENQYRELGVTGDTNVSKYIGVDRGALDSFSAFVGDFANQIRVALRNSSTGNLTPPPSLEDLFAESDDEGDESDEPQNEDTPQQDAPETDMGRMVINEIFRAQLEYLGERSGEELPPFYRAWTSDRNLADPQLAALSVRVFLSRNQLNALAQRLSGIVEGAREAELAPSNFFNLLQSLAATTSNDPNQSSNGFQNIAESGLLPTYLSQLPYQSKVLQLTQEDWLNWGMTGQQEFIDELEFKLTMYQQMNDDTDRWVNFGSADPGQDAYPVPLFALP